MSRGGGQAGSQSCESLIGPETIVNLKLPHRGVNSSSVYLCRGGGLARSQSSESISLGSDTIVKSGQNFDVFENAAGTFIVRDVIGDGRCLFRALSVLIY